MAALPHTQYPIRYITESADRLCVYALLNVNAGDTMDVSAEFSNAKRGVIVGTTVAAAAAMTVSGTTVTVPAGANGDAGYMMIWGCSA